MTSQIRKNDGKTEKKITLTGREREKNWKLMWAGVKRKKRKI